MCFTYTDFLNGGMKIATDMNGDIQQPKEPIESAAEVVDEMDPSQAAITAADARLVIFNFYSYTAFYLYTRFFKAS